MPITALGYVGLGADDLTSWTEFATGLLGMQMVERGNASRAFRMDDRKQRLILDRALPEGDRYFGWEVADAAALDALAAELERAGVAVRREPASLAGQRCVTGLISFADPAGNRLEAFHGAQLADTPFRPGRTLSGFKTGAQGMGHAVLMVPRIEDVLPFYRETLGFGLSDYVLTPLKAYFLHVNARHHSLALIEAPRNALHHVMVELFSLDDVGQGSDRALRDESRITATLGRHTNDFMTSFYVASPSGVRFEYGWGGREVDPATWEATEMHHGPSFWGHDQLHAPAEGRESRRVYRDRAADAGQRAPVQVMPGNFHTIRGVCPWWDSQIG